MDTIESNSLKAVTVSQAAELEKELSHRGEHAASRACQLEEEAADLRLVEHACAAALESMRKGQG
jgi:hypothetical protein